MTCFITAKAHVIFLRLLKTDFPKQQPARFIGSGHSALTTEGRHNLGNTFHART